MVTCIASGGSRVEVAIFPRSQPTQVGQTFVLDTLVISNSTLRTQVAVTTFVTSTFIDDYTYPDDDGFPVFSIPIKTIEQNGLLLSFRYLSFSAVTQSVQTHAVNLTVHGKCYCI